MPPFNPSTKVSLTIGLLFAGVLSLVGLGWEGANRLRDIKDSISALDAKISQLRLELTWHQRETWTITDMSRWSYRFELANRATPLVVPDPHTVHPPYAGQN